MNTNFSINFADFSVSYLCRCTTELTLKGFLSDKEISFLNCGL